MSEIDHEAAKLIAKQAIKIYGMAGGHLNVGLQRISLAYLDLHAQLAAERERVEALAELVYVTAEQASKLSYHDLKTKITAILNAPAQGDEA